MAVSFSRRLPHKMGEFSLLATSKAKKLFAGWKRTFFWKKKMA
jgi:hypothetical protein